jgi:chromosome segregation ATPase
MVMAVDRATDTMIAQALRDGSIADAAGWQREDMAIEVERLAALAVEGLEAKESAESLEGEVEDLEQQITEKDTEIERLLVELSEARSDADCLQLRLDDVESGHNKMLHECMESHADWVERIHDQAETIALQAEMIELLQARVARLTAWLPKDKRAKLGYA